MSNVRSLDWYRKVKSGEIEDPVKTEESTFDFSDVVEKNQQNEDIRRKQRDKANKNIVRNFNLRKGK